ncbi:CvpA family protein [Reyranella sp.]|uniref:CvpA family protein n=1 Tax=Reyranella sp. TaxID=1929291 RepID=UPI003D14737F
MDKLGINVFDVAVIVVAVFGAAIGMSAGFAHAVLFIVSWVGAGWIALNYSHLIEPEIVKLVQSAELAKFGSMLVVFVAALIVLVIVTNALSRTIRVSPLNKPDHILGGGFGVICAWVAMGVAYLFFTYLGPKPIPSVIESGATFPLIRDMANYVEPYLPQGFRARLTQKPDPAASTTPSPSPTIEAPKPPQ